MTKSFQAVATSIIDNILLINPNVDIKIGTAIRDVYIDVQSFQLQTLYSALDNSSYAQSILTARNQQLDRLGYNFGVLRNQPTRSSANVVITITGGLQTSQIANIGDQFYTPGGANNTVYTFINTQFTLVNAGQTQLVLPVVSLELGAATQVPAFSISKNSYDWATSCYNPVAATGGQDRESDPSYALRIPSGITGKSINTEGGIFNAVSQVNQIINKPLIITPESPLSRGQYTTDVYLQINSGYFGTPVQETAPANAQDYVFLIQPLYAPNPISQIQLFNPATQSYLTVPQVFPGTTNQQYEVLTDPGDPLNFFENSIKAQSRLHWIAPPPTLPYIISYNVDQPIIDAQTAFDASNEVTNDCLFKQAPTVPLYVSVTLSVKNGTDNETTYANADTNLTNFMNSLNTNQITSEDQIRQVFFEDSNVADAIITNLDTTYQVAFPMPIHSFRPFITQSTLTPLGYFLEDDLDFSASPYFGYDIAARFFIGNPDYITPTNYNDALLNFNYNFPSNNTGVTSEGLINSYTANWGPTIYPFYDSVNETLILNLSTYPPTGSTFSLNIVQPLIDTTETGSYITLAPPLISAVTPFSQTINTANPQYITILPNGLTFVGANVYKNGVVLNPTNSSQIGDYTILSGPDDNGIITLQFTQLPSPTDILQYGLLNPNITIVYSNDQFLP